MQSLSSSSLTQTSQLPQSSTREPFLVIENVSKIYPTPKGPYSVVEDVNLTVYEGEFVCLIGHSGCGKSTLLNMVAGFLKPSEGEVKLRGSLITKPGPDRMMVFQNYSLLPWKTAFENVDLAVKSAYPDKSKAERTAIVEEHLAMVGLTEAANKRPSELSGGMKQRVAIARALAIRPQVLILDEPFGALDAITKEELQEELLQIWREFRVTILMITHDIDEALFLADRLVMMTNGPAAKIGEVLEIPFTRPRNRASIMEDPRYYDLRNHALDFLFRRFAHSEEPAPADTKQEPMTSQETESVPAVSPTAEPAAAIVEKKDIPISAATPNLPVKIASTIALTAFTAFMVNGWMRQISEFNSAKQAQTQEVVVAPAATPEATTPATTSTLTSPAATPQATAPATTSTLTSPAATPEATAPAATSTLTSPAATPQATAPATSTLTSPAATSPLNLTEAIPQATAPTATPEAGLTTATPEATAPTATPEASTTTATSQPSAAQKISEPAQLEALNGNVYEQINQSWQTNPTFTEDLVYRVKVKPDGEIVSYEGVNQAASDYIQETPLPSLVKSAGSQTTDALASFAEFKVVLSPAGTLEVTPW